MDDRLIADENMVKEYIGILRELRPTSELYRHALEMSIEDVITHYGTKYHSGRYPYGSGEMPYQHDPGFYNYVKSCRDAGMSNSEIAKTRGLSLSEFTAKYAIANAEKREYDRRMAQKMVSKGMSKQAIADRLGYPNESSVRSLLDDTNGSQKRAIFTNGNYLMEQVDKYGYIDVSKGVERHMGINENALKNAIALAQENGYVLSTIDITQVGTGKPTKTLVLSQPGTEWKDVAKNKYNIKMVDACYSEDGATVVKVESPKSLSSDRISIVYAEDGGTTKDGVIELRRGVDDISLGNAKYAQVRILVDGTHYLKGMAIYADDLPDGIDIRFNTNKHQGTEIKGPDSAHSVLKPVEKDPENPFGATIKYDEELVLAQRHYIDANGEQQLSCINIVNEEGTWSTWSKNVSSQMLSKQKPELAEKQLKVTYEKAVDEFQEIMSYNNPTVRRELLEEFASECDGKATHLNSAAFPRQSTTVLLPVTSLKSDEVYAPGYEDGEQIALIRYPHAGLFEIPVLTVNNKNKEAQSSIGNAIDAIGITQTTAQQLSGADFDGDSVICIPMTETNVSHARARQELIDFDPKDSYRGYEGMHVMTKHERGIEMGKASNLITDMTIKGASIDEIVRAVKYSMVVIDAYKHELDYKAAAKDFNIAELRRIYQDGGGASTLLSKANSEEHVYARKEKPVYKMTEEEKARYYDGEVIFEYTNATKSKAVKDKEGAVVDWTKELKTEKSTKMMEAQDAYELVSGGSKEATTAIERVYADYANEMKALATQARVAARMETDIVYSPSAAEVYAAEVASLQAKLAIAEMNSPVERQAQRVANARLAAILYDNPELYNDYDKLKKVRGQELKRARLECGAKKKVIGSDDNPLTEREWEAINAGAVRKTTVKSIINNSDSATIKRLATPRASSKLSSAQLSMARQLMARGVTQAEIAGDLGVSVSTLNAALMGVVA